MMSAMARAVSLRRWALVVGLVSGCEARAEPPRPNAVAAPEPRRVQADPAPPADPAPAAPAKIETPSEPHPASSLNVSTPDQPIEDPSGEALAGFYDALARTHAGEPGALTRVLHLGDSSIGLDGVPHAIRRRMQTTFGDGGAGFVLVDRYSVNYVNRAARIDSKGGWDICYIAYLCKKDGHYGLGGHTFRGFRSGRSILSTLSEGPLGRTVSRFELWYAGRPKGGRIELQVDDGEPEVIETAAPQLEDRWHAIDVEPGPHRLQIRSKGGGYVRLYGVVMENDGPGVVWDSVSMIGAFTKRLTAFDDEHVASQVRHRDPDLLVLNYGGNDLRRLVSRSLDPEEYRREYAAVLEKLAAGKPDMACLVVSVIDHGRSGSRDVEPRHVKTMVETQRSIAFEHGCAFFDSVGAMGGPGAIRDWLKRSPSLASPDLKHLNHRGRDVMGEMIYEALLAGYVEHAEPK